LWQAGKGKEGKEGGDRRDRGENGEGRRGDGKGGKGEGGKGGRSDSYFASNAQITVQLYLCIKADLCQVLKEQVQVQELQSQLTSSRSALSDVFDH